jgi:hypothetical protein
MSSKYQVFARNYEDRIWEIALRTDNKLLAIRVYIKALFKYELVEFIVRKRR